jgi:hypothetical protein
MPRAGGRSGARLRSRGAAVFDLIWFVVTLTAYAVAVLGLGALVIVRAAHRDGVIASLSSFPDRAISRTRSIGSEALPGQLRPETSPLLDQAAAGGEVGEFGSGADAEFGEGMGEVGLDCGA